MHQKVLILDFGSQYTQLIARRIREMGVYSEIWPCHIPFEKIKTFHPQAIILSGGPASVLKKGAPKVDKKIWQMGIPLLGICYGMQLMAHTLGGKVVPSKFREYGLAKIKIFNPHSPLLSFIPENNGVWMSHGDSIHEIPPGFSIMAKTENGIIAGMGCFQKQIYALQFHPEVLHTQNGTQILKNFVFEIAHITPDWTMSSFIKEKLKEIKYNILKNKVILGLSGGVDSSVAAVLIHQAIKDQLKCIFIDNGVLREGEARQVKKTFQDHYKISLTCIDASKEFLKALKGIVDPEEKRKIIGKVFIRVFEREAKKIKGVSFLGQGTLYPDVIESVSFKGPSAVIKSHHNVGGLPKKMGLKLLEPFRELFKDEVRKIGRELGLPEEMIGRHPFPGPGLAIRIIGEITRERLRILRQADTIVTSEIKKSGFYPKLWQAFAVLLPVKSVGVMGDERTYENVCALRMVESTDGMTADWAELPKSVLGRISNRIINEVKGINRVVYDVSSKPPATIEWE
ncbi:MAG: glutamine-hydrolyzing GMP synthase [Deltaproteobacteria bacterium RIFCSPLOWO2_12_FULL_40_28]|nr:MAG: glutamine-hydrolyzing GMP synthase [Deltaproteobacteria bacterium RIFCSPHIGHO2_02_FULL_40_28]OGQ20872.1 MAG: glutamine-hydrolyzing GMP synthase [Deltaproteobacteria bacterium RIFCSPHIGHO2_12_FULL_40_32]OGQ39273.1 MAG: glutamine-hydrolyzing GMP synthase [Deltaproteobacteria bacterium RIFCSPLOWO2_02_FULL_40_36]OGQ54554.1 MAG: glutamine-hydrolyzing GMP synthase [Deltaproteobacteria bacterium RIFCSPLOWO2_12_FULL_40_28]